MKKFIVYIFLLIPNISHADLNSGLIGWWKLDETSGNAIDSSGQGNTGTPSGTTIIAGCRKAGCRSFNGTTDNVEIGQATFNGTIRNYTYTAWVNLNSVAGTRTIMAHGSRSFLQVQGGKAGMHFCAVGACNQEILGNISLSTGTWYHIAVVQSSTTGITVYVNGAQDVNSSGSPYTSDLDPYAGDYAGIGRYRWDGNPGGYTDGMIDDVRIYNRVLSASEILNLYNITSSSINNAVIGSANF